MRGDARAYFVRGATVAGDDAGDAICLGGVDHHQSIHLTVTPRLDQQRGFVEGQGVTGAAQGFHALSPQRHDAWMHDFFQMLARGGIAEDRCAQLATVEEPVRAHNARPRRCDFHQRWAARNGDDLARQHVGVDDGNAARGQQAGHGRLATADAAGKSDEPQAARHGDNANLRALTRQITAPVVRSATFVAETRTLASLPPAGPPEVAIAGRSNVGKSTLLNRLAARHSLARTSKTPGRTRGIIFYDLQLAGAAAAPGPLLRLADLPGYGYARVSQVERASWQQLLEGYTERRPTLALFVVLVDARRGIEAEERQLLEWLATLAMPARVAFTKVDKLTASQRGMLRNQLRTAVPGLSVGPPLLLSGETGEGVPELWDVILRALPAHAEPVDPAPKFAADD